MKQMIHHLTEYNFSLSKSKLQVSSIFSPDVVGDGTSNIMNLIFNYFY
jgi:hypothetical protein